MARRFKVKPIKKKTKKALNKVKNKLPSSAVEEEQPSARVTNDTVAEHREDVLSGGRKFLYPLQHSKHKVVIISAGLISILLISTVILSYLMLYRWQSTSNFAYRVTQIFPTPIARVDGKFVPYEKFLFELNSTIFYYTNHAQEGVDINGPEGEKIRAESKQQAMEKAQLDTLAEKIAKENGIEVTNEQVEQKIKTIQEEGGIGGYGAVLNDVLGDFYGWDINDLRRVVRLQLIRQEIPRVLDTETRQDAENALQELKDGAEFKDVALQYSDDKLTKENSGLIGEIASDNDDLPKEFIDAAFALEPGQTTENIIESPYGLHIIKVSKKKGDKIEVSHILFTYFNVDKYLRDRLQEVEVSEYITITDVEQ